MIRDLLDVVPRQRLKELILSSLGRKKKKRKREDLITVALLQKKPSKNGDQVFSIVTVRDTIRKSVRNKQEFG